LALFIRKNTDYIEGGWKGGGERNIWTTEWGSNKKLEKMKREVYEDSGSRSQFAEDSGLPGMRRFVHPKVQRIDLPSSSG